VTQAWFNQKAKKANKMKRTKNQKTKINQNKKLCTKVDLEFIRKNTS
jgi:hypothetical protein